MSHDRSALIDCTKGLACAAIVWHHLAFYGPMSDQLGQVLPGLMAWLQEDARMAVQVFLVLGGFLAAASLAPRGHARFDDPWQRMARRFVRLVLPYAVAPAVAAVLWIFLFNPGRGLITHFLGEMGYDWNHAQNSGQAMFLVVFASVWKQISYNFLFFFAALQSIPRSLVEAAAIDGAGPIRRFFKLALPLIAPVSFFLLVVNLVYAFFDTFPVIDAATAGGPVQATTTLIYKIYREGFVGLDLASSAAQSVVLMFLVIILTVVQFRYVESKVRYQ